MMRVTRAIALPIVALAALPGPRQLVPAFMPSSRATGPCTTVATADERGGSFDFWHRGRYPAAAAGSPVDVQAPEEAEDSDQGEGEEGGECDGKRNHTLLYVLG